MHRVVISEITWPIIAEDLHRYVYDPDLSRVLREQGIQLQAELHTKFTTCDCEPLCEEDFFVIFVEVNTVEYTLLMLLGYS